MLELDEYTYKIDYLKNDNTHGVVYYTVMAINDEEARIKVGEKFRIDRQSLINT